MNRTAQREAILKELRSVKTHPTADELYAALRVKLPTISLGTVYRNLEHVSGRDRAEAGDCRQAEEIRRRYIGASSHALHGLRRGQ